jgi:hypothetical protein
LHGFEKNSDAYWVGVCPVIFNEESWYFYHSC